MHNEYAMKLQIRCALCGEHAESELVVATPLDDGQYDVACPAGHHVIATLDPQGFALLYEEGVHALADGYYREAVISFAASLERFYESFLRASLLQRDVSTETIEACWKEVRNQSERQLGGFIFAYASEFGTQPTLLQKKQIELRNAVTHRGKIPTHQEAIDYGQEVLDLLRGDVAKVQDACPDGVRAITPQAVWRSAESGLPADCELEITRQRMS